MIADTDTCRYGTPHTTTQQQSTRNSSGQPTERTKHSTRINALDETGLAAAGPEYWLDDDDRTLFVAETDGELVGYASAGLVESPPIYERGRRAHIDSLYVKPDFRRQGIARRLIDRVEAWAIENDCALLGITAHTENAPARRLYEADFEMKFASYRRWIE